MTTTVDDLGNADRNPSLVGRKSIDTISTLSSMQTVTCSVNNSSKNEKIESEENDDKVLIEITADAIMNEHHFLKLKESKEIRVYQNGVYVIGGDTLVEKLLEEKLGYKLKNHRLSEIKGHIKRRTYRSIKELDKDINIINLQNGLYDINKDELKPHDVNYYSIDQKHIFYNSKAKPKLFGKFLSQVLYGHDVRTVIEVMGYTFFRDCPFEHFFKLHGYGANGKSVFTGLLTKIHGTANVSNVSFLSLIDEKFALADLEFKDINIDTELSNATIKDISMLKKLTGGRKQPIRIERKFQHSYDTSIYTKLFFNANTIPDTIDKTTAFYRRQIIISFPNTFEGKDDDPHPLDKITTEEEISGIFNVLMHALKTLLKNKRIYLNEKTVEERRLKHEMVVNPVKSFLNNAFEKDYVSDDYITKSDMYEAYRLFCKEYSLAHKSIGVLGREINKEKIAEGREGTGERRNCWFGVKLKPKYVPKVYEQQSVTSYIE